MKGSSLPLLEFRLAGCNAGGDMVCGKEKIAMGIYNERNYVVSIYQQFS